MSSIALIQSSIAENIDYKATVWLFSQMTFEFPLAPKLASSNAPATKATWYVAIGTPASNYQDLLPSFVVATSVEFALINT